MLRVPPSPIPPHSPLDMDFRRLPSSTSWVRRTKMPLPVSAVAQVVVLAVAVVVSALFLRERQIAPAASVCVSYDKPNPIADLFPFNATGVLNVTLAILPIPLDTARQLIPKEYGILEQAYRSLIQDFPEGMYPMLVQAGHDHDVQLRGYNLSIEDFSRVGLEFPFLDLLGDGYSSFRWAPAQLISASNEMALQGSQAYGTKASGAVFEPLCNAYELLRSGTTFFRGQSTQAAETFVELEFTRTLKSSATASPYPFALFRNITNQPTFANGSTCDNMIRMFGASMSEPVPVMGRVRANIAPLRAEKRWESAWGIQVATPFVENNYLDCSSMQGYDPSRLPVDVYKLANGND